jgi:hypothetical protein
MRSVAIVLLLAVATAPVLVQSFTTKSTCKLLNKESSFIDLTDTSSDCAANCASGKSFAECKCKSFGEPAKPYPSLAQCYKWNQEACCKSGHDAVISSKYSQLMSTTCIRTFPDLEFFYCLGCNNKQFKYVDVAQKKIQVCSEFAKKLWDTASYYQCGLNLGSGPTIIPEFEFDNATHFLNHASIKPPFFDDYTVVVGGGEGSCLTNVAIREFVSVVTLAVWLVMQLSIL